MDSRELNVDELLSKSTVREDFPLTVNGNFQSGEDAQQLLYTVFGLARFFGTVFDLTGLDGITIADDYVAALAGVDRGFPDMKAAKPTSDEFGTGFAMAVPVLRNGEHKSHVVLNSAVVRPLVDPANERYDLAVHTLAHELAHVYDHMLRNKAMPNYYGSQTWDLRDDVLGQFAMAAWDEYAASRLSAGWGTPVRLSPGLRQPVKKLVPFDGKSFPFAGQSFNLMLPVKRRRATLASDPSRNSRPELIGYDWQGVFFPACPIPWQWPDRKRDTPQG